MLKALFIFGMFYLISSQDTLEISDSDIYWSTLPEWLHNIKRNYGNSITAALVIIISSLIILIIRDETVRRRLDGLKATRRISVEEYERSKVDNTKAAVEELENSEAYQDLRRKFENGEWNKVELEEEEKIVLSDDEDE